MQNTVIVTAVEMSHVKKKSTFWFPTWSDTNHCGESKTQRKWFLDDKRDGLVDENRVNNKENKNNRAVFMLYRFAYNIRPMPK